MSDDLMTKPPNRYTKFPGYMYRAEDFTNGEFCVFDRSKMNESWYLEPPKHQWLIKKMPDGPTTTARTKRAEFVSEQGLGMRVHRVYMSFAISIGCGIASQNVAFSQEYRGTAEQQMACTPDVWRLCGAQIPDVDRIVACLPDQNAIILNVK